jgi:mRNA interferase MazF
VKRGDVVLVAVSGDYGKPRPALIVQSDLFDEHPSVSICLVSTHLQQTPLFRYQLEPESGNGLSTVSQVQIDKIMTIPRQKVGKVVGSLTARQMSEITRLIAFWFGIGDTT